MTVTEPGVRLDKWLWAARFFRTRGLAAEAVDGGKVQVNGTRGKRGKLIRPGDALRVRKGPYEYEVSVLVAAERRVAASQVETLYRETPQSEAARRNLVEQLRLAREAGFRPPEGKPTKRDRRLIRRFKEPPS